MDTTGDMSYFLKKSGGIKDGYSYPRHFFHFDGALYLLACYDNGIYRLATTDSLPQKVMEIQPLSGKAGLEPMDFKEWQDYCRGKYFEYATDLKIFDEGRLLHLGLKRDGVCKNVLWDRKQKQAYQWPLNGFPYLVISCGHNSTDEFFAIPPHKVYELDSDKLTLTGKKLRDLLVQTLGDKQADDENMYVVRLRLIPK